MTTPDSIPEDRANVEKARNLLRRASAVIFDFDGLLVDTEYAIYASWLRVFDSCGHPLPLDLFNQCLGSGYTHWNPGDHLEKLTGRTFDWDEINALRQKEIVRDLEHAGLLPEPANSSAAWRKKEFPWPWPPAPLIAGWTAG